MQTTNQIIGKIAEDLARNYLQRCGLKFIVANYRCKCGEIDLIMRDCETMVFVEVRHRKFCEYGDGIATITRTKQRRIINAAVHYLKINKLVDKFLCRFDIVATSAENVNDSKIKWIKDAFWNKW